MHIYVNLHHSHVDSDPGILQLYRLRYLGQPYAVSYKIPGENPEEIVAISISLPRFAVNVINVLLRSAHRAQIYEATDIQIQMQIQTQIQIHITDILVIDAMIVVYSWIMYHNQLLNYESNIAYKYYYLCHTLASDSTGLDNK